ncbi:MAG: MFS transporter [Cyanobacteriota bacterium]
MNPLSTLRRLDAQTQRNFILLFGAALFFWVGLTTLLPTLPSYAQKVGASHQQVGLVMGAFAIGLLGSRVWLGQLVDRRGRRAALLIGAFVGTAAPLGYLWGDTVPLLIVIRAFHGVSVAAFTTGFSALVVDLAPPKQRGELIGYMSLAVPVGMALGPALGGYLETALSYEFLFTLSAALGGVALGLIWLIREAPRPIFNAAVGAGEGVLNRTMLQLLISPGLLIPSLVLLLIGLVFGNLATFLPLFIKEIPLAINVGLFYTVAAMTSFIARVWTGQASDLYGRGVFIAGSLVSYIGAMILLGNTYTVPVFLLAAALEGIGAGVLIPMTIALISDRSSLAERGRVFAVCVSGFDVGIALAGPIFGFSQAWLGFRGLFGVTSALACLALALFASQGNPSWRSSLGFALAREKDLYALRQEI